MAERIAMSRGRRRPNSERIKARSLQDLDGRLELDIINLCPRCDASRGFRKDRFRDAPRRRRAVRQVGKRVRNYRVMVHEFPQHDDVAGTAHASAIIRAHRYSVDGSRTGADVRQAYQLTRMEAKPEGSRPGRSCQGARVRAVCPTRLTLDDRHHFPTSKATRHDHSPLQRQRPGDLRAAR